MANTVGIYSLGDPAHLQNDIESLIKSIDNLYTVNYTGTEISFFPKTFVSNKSYWTSDEVRTAFNKMIPEIKSLTRDMYSILEILL